MVAENKNNEPNKQQIQFDGDAPRMAVYVWLEDGTCHQVMTTMKHRIGVMRCLMREHGDGDLKVSQQSFPIKWRKDTASDGDKA
jgi:hypothetical protein